MSVPKEVSPEFREFVDRVTEHMRRNAEQAVASLRARGIEPAGTPGGKIEDRNHQERLMLKYLGALSQLITAQLRAGKIDLTTDSVLALAQESGYDVKQVHSILPGLIAEARELVELEKRPRVPAPDRGRRVERVDDLNRAYPFLAGWASSCPNGWLGLLEQACAHIAAITPPQQLFSLRTTQLKDKFGGLRWYLEGYVCVRVLYAAAAAETISWSTCSACGNTGTIRNRNGWYCTLCDSCAKLKDANLLLRIHDEK